MGKKYDELMNEQLKVAAEISAELVGVAVEVYKIDQAVKEMMKKLMAVSDLNASIAKGKESR